MPLDQTYNFINLNFFHTLEMPEWAFVVADLAAGTAPKIFYLHDIIMLF